MINKQINIRIPKTLYKESEIIIKEEGFSNLQELIKQTLREKIKEHQIIKELEKLKGISKSRKVLTKIEKDKIARELTSKKSEEIIKKYGLEEFSL